MNPVVSAQSWALIQPVTATLVNGWTSIGYGIPAPSYARFGNLVILDGAATGGTANSVFTLPAGFRPASMVPVAGYYTNVSIDSSGVVSAETVGQTIYLGGVTFLVP